MTSTSEETIGQDVTVDEIKAEIEAVSEQIRVTIQHLDEYQEDLRKATDRRNELLRRQVALLEARQANS